MKYTQKQRAFIKEFINYDGGYFTPQETDCTYCAAWTRKGERLGFTPDDLKRIYAKARY